jgi:cysteinyl-tRNA synthetase
LHKNQDPDPLRVQKMDEKNQHHPNNRLDEDDFHLWKTFSADKKEWNERKIEI